MRLRISNFHILATQLAVLALALVVGCRREASTLLRASGTADTKQVLRELQSGADPNRKGSGDVTALFVAAFVGDSNVVAALLSAGADTRLQTSDGATALHAAAYGANCEIVKALLRAGAQVNIADRNGATPLMLACGARNDYITGSIHAALNNPPGTTYHVSATGRCAVVGVLLDAGARVGAIDHQSNTAIEYAVQGARRFHTVGQDEEYTGIVEMLVNALGNAAESASRRSAAAKLAAEYGLSNLIFHATTNTPAVPRE